MNRLLVDFGCSAEANTAGRLRKIFQQVLLSSVQEKSFHHNILLCLSEVVANIVQHNQKAETQIQVRFEQSGQSWELRIFDDGDSYDSVQHSARDLSNIDPDAENGRGIALLHACCDSVDYRPGDENNPNLTICCWNRSLQSSRQKVLIVEDDSSSCRLYSHYLGEFYEVFEAHNGEEAMEVLAQTSVDLVLSDIKMPTMDGLTLRSEIIQSSELELVPFVFLTGNEDEDMLGRANSLGIDDYLIKPVSKENLTSCVERVLQRNKQVLDRLSDRINRKISESSATDDPASWSHWTAAVYRRGTGTGGGDLLLSKPVDDGSLVALIDTMGHDETSKFFSFAYGGFISGMMASAQVSDMGCHDLLRLLSQTAYNDELLSKTTLTGVIFKLEPEGMMTMASAAHPQPLRVSSESIESIPVEGVLPGLLPDSEYTPVEISVKKGERIAIFTDGLLESAADNPSRARLESEILTTIQETINMPIDRASRFVMQMFDEMAGTPPRDDTTFILLEPDFYSTEVTDAR